MTARRQQMPSDRDRFRTSRARRRVLKGLAGILLSAGSAQSSAPGPQPMPTRPIPRTRESLPMVGLGTWQTFDVGAQPAQRGELKDVLRAFVAAGASVVDSSPMYGQAERVVGDLTSELGVRDSLFLATKVWTTGRDAGIRQMESSFSLMRTRRMDLMQVHNLLDVETHTATLREWKAAGRVRYIGITHYHAGAYADLERLVKTGRYDFVQLNYSMAERDADARLLPLCAEAGVAVLVNRPFAEGSLFRRTKGKSLPPWAAEIDCASWGQFFLKWILGHPAVTCVIPATRRVAHVRDNVGAAHGRLPDAAMRRRMLDHLQQA
jgi:aryl-alcohol dehydrogenase-like predicted oxidoreductase